MAKDLTYKILCRNVGGTWIKTTLPTKDDAVGSIGDSVAYKMGFTFGILPQGGTLASRCHFKSLPGDFLIVAQDGSLAVMKKSEYSKYFPKKKDSIPASVKTQRDLKGQNINPKS